MPEADWRRLRYHGNARHVRRTAVAATLKFGPGETELVTDQFGLASYLADDPSSATETASHYILVRADKQTLDDNAVAFIRPVSKLDFSGKPLLNFHVWFHRLAPSGVENQVMFGMRLEGPEGGDTHDYYHAQPLSQFGSSGECQGMPEHFSQKFPTIPLNAADVLELCLNTVLVACGKDALRSIVRGAADHAIRSAARDFWKKMFGSDPLEPEVVTKS